MPREANVMLLQQKEDVDNLLRCEAWSRLCIAFADEVHSFFFVFFDEVVTVNGELKVPFTC